MRNQYIFKPFLFEDELFTGHKNSDCPIPCKTTHTKIMKTAESESSFYNVIYITFSDTVKTTEITIDKFIFMESLNFLGSNLGLWPGLGLYQLLEGGIGVIVVYKILEKTKRLLKL